MDGCIQNSLPRTVSLVIQDFLSIRGHDYKFFISWNVEGLSKDFHIYQLTKRYLKFYTNKHESGRKTSTYLSSLFFESSKIKNAA